MRNTINEKIEKFISDHRNTKIVHNLFAANETRDRSRFVIVLKQIRECISLQEKINGAEQSIKYHSEMIKMIKKEKNEYRQKLKLIRDGRTTKIKDGDLFSDMGIEVQNE